jgi:predicted GIY-YIG superfamily endonuclease
MNVYILELKDDKYYVGLTSDMSHRYKSHCRGRGSSWTKEHSPIKIISIEEGDKYLERKITLEMMKKYGWENVRGGGWCQRNLKNPPVELLNCKKEILFEKKTTLSLEKQVTMFSKKQIEYFNVRGSILYGAIKNY